MEQGYLVDTNTVVDYLENKLPPISIEIIDNITIQFSVITRIELLVWPKITIQQIKILNDFISSSTVLNLNERIIIETIKIRKDYRLKLPDAIIAATATVNNLALITRNINDFKRVPKLKYTDPYHL